MLDPNDNQGGEGAEMKAFEWKPEYEVGIRQIDDQHCYFVGLINRFVVEFTESSDSKYLGSLIDELNAYAKFHFLSEENMMLRAGYPGYEAHQHHHHDLLDQLGIKEIKLSLDASEARKEEVVNYLVTWFLNHSNHEDRLFADYMREHHIQA